MKKSLKNLRRILLGLAVRTIKPNTPVSDLVNRLYHLQPYHYLQEDIFGFSGYVCSECMTVNAKILKFSSQHLGLASNYSLNPL